MSRVDALTRLRDELRAEYDDNPARVWILALLDALIAREEATP